MVVDEGDLASGASASGEALVTFLFARTVTNTADAVGNNGRSGGNFAELTDSDGPRVVGGTVCRRCPAPVTTRA